MKIDFEIETKYGLYRGAIDTPINLSNEQIEAIKTERINNWIAIIEAPCESPNEFKEVIGENNG